MGTSASALTFSSDSEMSDVPSEVGAERSEAVRRIASYDTNAQGLKCQFLYARTRAREHAKRE